MWNTHRGDDAKDPTMILVLYEKLPDLFCFDYGKIGHHVKKCDADDSIKSTHAFGSWLRAGRRVEYRKPNTFINTRFEPRGNLNGPRPPPRGNQEETRDPRPLPEAKIVVQEKVKEVNGGEGVVMIVQPTTGEENPSDDMAMKGIETKGEEDERGNEGEMDGEICCEDGEGGGGSIRGA